jgi:hypothetical protein
MRSTKVPAALIEARHEEIVDQLIERLEKKNYDRILKHVRYKNSSGIECEWDVIAERGDHRHYYEVKSSFNHYAVERATVQFTRAYFAIEDRKWKFILVTPERIKYVRYHDLP